MKQSCHVHEPSNETKHKCRCFHIIIFYSWGSLLFLEPQRNNLQGNDFPGYLVVKLKIGNDSSALAL